jgi:fructose-bisphosphate aldolase class 1
MLLEPMIRTARAIVAPGKGILVADESTPTMAKRLAAPAPDRHGVTSCCRSRRHRFGGQSEGLPAELPTGP